MDNLVEFFGRLHPLIVHLPIGFLMLTVCFHGLVWRGKYAAHRALLPVLWFACCVSAVLACLAGYLLSLSGGYGQQALQIHMYLGIALALASGLVYVLLQKGYSGPLSLGGVALVALLLVATGHYGGNLTHGEDYLTQPIYAMLEKAPAKRVRPPITNLEQALVYRDLVEPILEQKCWQCHSAKKQKGKLRLDGADFLLKGGKHGPVIAAGNAHKSDLYQRLLLPETDDKRMPPKGKSQLTEAEVQLIHWWITKGETDFDKKVADLEKDEPIKLVLAGIGPGAATAAGAAPVSEIPRAKVAKPNPGDLQKLEQLGVAFTALSPDHTFLAASLVNNSGFNDGQLRLLLALRDQILWLDMSETAITDKALPQIAQFKNLTRLKLDRTNITDAGISHLKKLTHLHTLNLYGTQVSDKGLQTLQSCKNLKFLYLWQTQATAQGVAALQKAMGEEVEINFGNTTDHTGSL